MNRIWFICKAGNGAGIGHLARCVHVAEYLKDMRVQSNILVLHDEPITLPESYSEVEIQFIKNEELHGLYISRKLPEVIILDLGKMDREVFGKFHSLRIPLISLSPIFEFNKEVDLYICRIPPLGPPPSQSRMLVDPGCVVFNSKIPRTSAEIYKRNITYRLPRISIVLGGGRPESRYASVLSNLSDFKDDCEFIIYVGAIGGCTKSKLEELCNKLKFSKFKITEFCSSEKMWSEVSDCSVVICEGGLIAWEAAYCGIPFIAITDKDFQKSSLEYLISNRCGESLDSKISGLSPLKNILCDYIKNPSKLAERQESIVNLQLQNGGVIVAKYIKDFLKLKKVTPKTDNEALTCAN